MPIVRFDHAVFGVQDLDAAREDLRAGGFHLAGGGVHVGKGTANELVRLTTGYLELLTIADRQQAMAHGGSRRQASEFLDAHTSGPLGFALEVTDANWCKEELAGRGIRTSGPHDMARTQPDGRRISWRTVLIDDRQWLSPHPFLIQWDGTDRWAAASSVHPNGVKRVSKVVVSSPDVAATLGVYRALGAVDIHDTPDGAALTMADITVKVLLATGRAEVGLRTVVLDGMPDVEPQYSLRAGMLGHWLSR